ncbi:MAG: pilus assembly protein PilP [bacterium]
MHINKKQFIIYLGGALLSLVLGYVADINFLQKRLYLVREQKIKTSQLLQVKRQEIQKEIAPVRYVAKLKWFNNSFDITDILNSLEKAVTYSQVELQVIEPQAIKEDDVFIVYPVKLTIVGQYKNLLGFINAVFKQSYFIVFEELILQKKEDNKGDELNIQALITVYRNKTLIPEGATKESLPLSDSVVKLPEHDVFMKAIGKTSLFLWAISELTFLGMIKQGQNIYGFVGDPAGGIHRVVVGDKIGLKQSKITTIDERGIVAAGVFIGR